MSKSAGYEVTPVQLRIAAVNQLPDDVLADEESADGAWIWQKTSRGLGTLPTSVQWAADRRRSLIAECQRLIRARELAALHRMIEINPELALDQSIRSGMLKLSEAARYRRGPGRRANSPESHPLLIVGLVGDLIRTKRARNLEQAFYALEDLNIWSYETAKRQYYRARAEPRFRGLLTELEQSHSQSAEEAESLLQAGERLKPGGRIRRSVYVPEIGAAAEAVFTATENGPRETEKASSTDARSDNTLVVTDIRIEGLKGPKG